MEGIGAAELATASDLDIRCVGASTAQASTENGTTARNGTNAA
ncbi:unnamed protein product [Laminaria digitata]